jgi:hypothetical protein
MPKCNALIRAIKSSSPTVVLPNVQRSKCGRIVSVIKSRPRRKSRETKSRLGRRLHSNEGYPITLLTLAVR